MKRTVTEIFIEVEEIAAVRMKEKSVNAESELNHLTNNHRACPFGGRAILKTITEKFEEEQNK